MEIGPISPIRPVQMVKPSPTPPDLSHVFEAEYLGESKDDEYTPSRRKARKAEDDEDDLGEDEGDPEAGPETATPAAKVSLFA